MPRIPLYKLNKFLWNKNELADARKRVAAKQYLRKNISLGKFINTFQYCETEILVVLCRMVKKNNQKYSNE